MTDTASCKSRKRRRIATVILGLAVVALFPLPFPINESDKEAAAIAAMNAVLHNHVVLHSTSIRRLSDCSFVKMNGRLYFQNNLGVSDDVFLRYGLKPIPSDRAVDVDAGDVVLSFMSDESDPRRIYFSYTFGSLGGQGYAVSIHKSLVTRWFIYSHQWIS